MASSDPTICHCKNLCNRGANKRGGCPCLANGTFCSSMCQCGTGKMKCSNRLGRGRNRDWEEEDCSGEESEEEGLIVAFGDDPPFTVDSEANTSLQHAAEDQSEASFIVQDSQDIPMAEDGPRERRVESGNCPPNIELRLMSRDSLISIIERTVAMYPDLMAHVLTPRPPQEEEAPVWCNCGRCRPMPTPDEELCCRHRMRPGPCISVTSAGPINHLVLSRECLHLAVINHNEVFVTNDSPDSNDTLRHMAYRQFVLWRFGHLGRHNRVVIPSCVVCLVRQHYPSVDGVYTGFKRPDRLTL